MHIQIPILMYHQVRDMNKKEHLSSLAVPVKRFRFQMRLLKKMGYKGVSMTELMPYLKGEKQGKVAGITFDDGYLNNLTNALPALREMQFSATSYIVKDRIGKTNDWNPELNQQELMNRDHIQEWIGAGMEIGSHTLNHINLAQADKTSAQAEIYQSKEELEQIFGIAVNHFCYPYGGLTEHSVELVKKAGYLSAATTARSRCHSHENMFRLPRVVVAKHTLPHLFYMKIATRYEDKKRKPKLT